MSPRALILLAALTLVLTPHLASGKGNYQNFDEIQEYMSQVADNFPESVTLERLGSSRLGKPVNYLVVSDKAKPGPLNVYFSSAHHGDEKASVVALIGILQYLLDNRKKKELQEIWRTYTLYFHPLVNPDGYAIASRYDSLGRDPNRDYSYPGKPDEEAFEIPEIKLVSNLMEQVHFTGALAFHSGMEGVLWPWAHSAEKNPHERYFRQLARDVAKAMDLVYYAPSSHDYVSKGEFIDYAYMKYKSLALTLEVSLQTTPGPKQLPRVVRRSIMGSLAYLKKLAELDLEIKKANGSRSH